MKKLIIFTVSICFMMYASTMQGQEFNPKKNNYLILSKNIQQLKPVLLTANELRKEDGKKYGSFYVIMCGKTVSDIPNNTDFNQLLKQVKDQNVKVFICGISLNTFHVNRAQLPEGVELMENGILYGFQLTKKGFITLTI